MTMPIYAVCGYDKYNPLPPTQLQAELMKLLEIRRQAKLDVHFSMCEKALEDNPQYSVTLHCVKYGLSFCDAKEINLRLIGEKAHE